MLIQKGISYKTLLSYIVYDKATLSFQIEITNIVIINCFADIHTQCNIQLYQYSFRSNAGKSSTNYQ